MDVAVVALGKIGLPLAVQIAGMGHRVHGADISGEVVDLVNAGTPPFPGETHLDTRLADVVTNGTLTATTDTAKAVARSEAVIVVVPLLVDGNGQPEFRAIDAATADIAAGIRPGTLVSFETTIPLGTTRNRFAPALEQASGLVVGQDLFVCHSPERVNSGRIFADLSRYPKVVGAVDPRSAQRAVEFYSQILTFDERDDLPRPNGVWDLGSAEAAELTKLAETTYRDVNIALANTFARHADSVGVDIHQVIQAANSQPYSHIHTPGVAVGGHCIPVYPRFYLAGDPDADLVRTAREVNEGMPHHTVEQLRKLMGGLDGRTVVVLGAAYRGGVKETAFSGVFDVIQALQAAGATALVHDPLYSDEELRTLDLTPYEPGQPVDGAIVQADHGDYRGLSPADLPGITAIVDGRGVLDRGLWDVVRFARVGDGITAV